MKIRKQVYFDQDTEKDLREFAILMGKTETSIIREAVKRYIQEKQKEQREKENPLYKIIGLCEEGEKDASFNHDRYLYKKDKD